jgi:hypothetical protein
MGGIVTGTPGDFGMPGLSPKLTMKTRKFLLNDKHVEYKNGVVIEKGTVDAGSSPTDLLRPGLILVRVETGANKGKFVQTSHADAPIAADVKDAVILANYVHTKGPDGTTADRAGLGVIHGMVDEGQIIYVTADATYKANIKAALKLVQFVPALA